ncbi:MAG: hypothetical protein ACLQAT_18825 [Candidatus Binataceae bacterium]
MESYYLYERAIRGDEGSLNKLTELAASRPVKVIAVMKLADYYAHFERAAEAVQVLVAAGEAASTEDRFLLILDAVDLLSEAGNLSAALDKLRELAAGEESAEKGKSVFQALANIAGAHEQRFLEAAALEKLLDMTPNNMEVRFRLAYLYSQMSKSSLSIYHYLVRAAQGKEPATLNNLGVEFDKLQLPGKEIHMYEQASQDSLLAKANLSHAYIDRGFLETAETIAHAVAKEATANEDEQANARSVSALERIKEQRKKEIEAETKAKVEAKRESLFQVRYAEAFLGRPATIEGEFETRHGRLVFAQDGFTLSASATFKALAPSSQYMSLLTGSSSPSTLTKVEAIALTGTVSGRTAKFQLSVIESYEGGAPLLLKPSTITSSVKGYLILADDGKSLEMLEETEEKKVTINTAPKVSK